MLPPHAASSRSPEPAKETPDVPAVDIVPEDAPEILKIVLRVNKMHPKAPEAPTIREFAVDLARTAGFQALKTAAASRNPEALVRMDRLRAAVSNLPSHGGGWNVLCVFSG